MTEKESNSFSAICDIDYIYIYIYTVLYDNLYRIVLYYKKNYKRKLKQWWSIIPPISPKWVSEWVLFNANWTIFQPYHGKNKLIINEMIMRYKTNTLNWILIVLAHWNNSPRIDMSLHMHTLFWFRGNPYLLFLLNAACSAEKQQIHQNEQPPLASNH
jgi:hypothetical protein